MTTPTIAPGTPVAATAKTFRNGVDGIRAHGANWAEPLTVVRTVPGAYGCTRYVVVNANGGRMYATGPETTNDTERDI